jgi:cytosine permease
MFAGTNICLPMMMAGGVLVPGISFTKAILVGLLGIGLAACFICLASYPGTDHGLPASVVTRISLGLPWGASIASLAIVCSSVGWFAVQAELAGYATDGIVQGLSGFSAPVLMIGLMGVLNILFAVTGFGWIRRLATWAVPALLALAVLLFGRIASSHPFLELMAQRGDGAFSILAAMSIMISGQIAALSPPPTFHAMPRTTAPSGTESWWA